MSQAELHSALRGRVVLVTGGSGFVGSALVQRLSNCGTGETRVLTRTSNVSTSSEDARVTAGLRVVVGDIWDEDAAREAVRGVHVIFHLAAVKSVEISEARPAEAIRTNVLGTEQLLRAAAAEPNLERFIAISSDKAANPTTVYGLTKALMERLVMAASGPGKSDFGVVRLGNVWGSTGSVLLRWQEAARRGAQLTVTDPRMTRFVMLRSQAVDLILHAVASPLAGSILSRVMPAYVLGDLAAVLSEVHGLTQQVTGSRPGEKLDEDLVSEGEAPFTERTGDLFRITPGRRTAGTAPFSSANAQRLTRRELRELLEHPDASSL